MKQLSNVGLSLLKNREGYSSKLYSHDNNQIGNCSIGYGHLVHYGPCDGKSASEQLYLKGIKMDTATKILSDDVADAVNTVNRHVGVNLTQNQFDALVVLTYNIGSRNFSTSTLLHLINTGILSSKNPNAKILLKNAFMMWDKAGNQVSNGLKERRKQETELFIGE